MLKRDIWNDFIEWKSRKHHPLVLSGLRQVGKTFAVREFGEKNYEHVVYLDLRANKTAHRVFEGDFDVDTMVLAISAITPTARFVPGQTLIILDEIQDCPNARSSLKYWDIDGRYDVIATGSFLGVKGFREPYPRGVPVGYEEHAQMRPLSFREFVVNLGLTPEVLEHVCTAFSNKSPVNKAVHERLRALYYQYLVVGGMPEAVNEFFNAHDLNAVREVQRRILTSIRDDFGRFRDGNGIEKVNETLKLRAEACLDSMPAQLSKEYKKFKYSLVNAKGNSPQKADGLQYLEDVGLVLKAFNVREISNPLEGAKVATEFKVFYSDLGLLISQLDEGTAAQVLDGDLSPYKGAIAENMVACALASYGMQPYYYHAPSGSPEIDFVFSYRGTPTLVECKSTNNRMTSMKYVLSHPKKYGVHPAMKFADTNVGGGESFVTYPHYALGFLFARKPSFDVEPITLSDLVV